MVLYNFRETEIVGHKDLKLIQTEIRDVIRQITGCVTFLPMLDCPCKPLYPIYYNFFFI